MTHAEQIAAARDRVVDAARYYASDDKGGNPYAGEESLISAVQEMESLEAQTCAECGGHALRIFPAPGGFQRGIVHEKCPACSGTGAKREVEK